jgi:hypothetical protein
MTVASSLAGTDRDEHEGLCMAQKHFELSKHKFTFISAGKGELLQQVDLRALQ